jgi:hypothetical protein
MLAAPRGLSQPPTSFIGSWCPGIHRVPLTTWPHKTPTTTTHQRRAPATGTYKKLATELSVKKMLASTVQFSTYDQSPPDDAPARTPSTAGAVRGPGGPGTRARTTLVAGPLPQDPTACLRPRTPHRPRSPHRPPKGGRCRTRSRPEPAAELVSVPPSSTTPDTRGPPQSAIRHGLGAALHHRASLGGECSLERR